jgi:threonine-phosphate decarboxylase
MGKLKVSPDELPQRLHGGNVHAFARKQGIPLGRVLDFSASINPFGPPAGVLAVYRQSFRDAVLYPEPYAESLTAELAAYHGIDSGSVLVGNGATHLIHLLAQALRFRHVLLVAPLFSEYQAAFTLNGGSTDTFLLEPPDFSLSLDGLRRRLHRGFNAVVLTNPNSPTGALVPRDRVAELAAACARKEVYLILDEAFIDLVEEESCKHLAAKSDLVVVIRSLTKVFALPGLRLGYLMASPKTVRRLKTHLEPWSVNGPAQAVARLCLRDATFIERSRRAISREREWLKRQLTAIGGLFSFPSQANFLLVQIIRKRVTATALSRVLAKEGILIRSCEDFIGLDGRFIRVAVRRHADNRRLLAALKTFFAK